nr:Alpha helical Porin B [Streptococcus thermophilus]
MRFRSAAIATALAAVAATGAFGATQAEAQNDLYSLTKILNGNIATLDCNAMKTVLRGSQLAGPDTTRGQLVNSLTEQTRTDARLALLTAPTINALGDRALECGAVKPDPVTPESEAVAFASKLSADAGLPELRDILPAVAPESSR